MDTDLIANLDSKFEEYMTEKVLLKILVSVI